MKRLIFSTVVTALLVACSGGGGGGGPDPVVDLSLDGIYRGSPVVISARDFTYDYEYDSGGPGGWRNVGTSGRVFTTTVHGNDVSGTATLYKPGGVISTAALTGTITPGGAMSLRFQDGSTGEVNVDVQRLGGQSKDLLGRAWCTYDYDGVTVYYCSEFDVLNILRFSSPAHGTTRDLITLTLGEEVTPNVYDASIAWDTCGNLSGLVGIAESEDGVYDELAITVVGGSCGFAWFLLTSIR